MRLSLLSFAVTALLPSQCCHHAAVTPLTFHNQTVKLQSVTDDSKFIFLFIGESISSTYKCNISFNDYPHVVRLYVLDLKSVL